MGPLLSMFQFQRKKHNVSVVNFQYCGEFVDPHVARSEVRTLCLVDSVICRASGPDRLHGLNPHSFYLLLLSPSMSLQLTTDWPLRCLSF